MRRPAILQSQSSISNLKSLCARAAIKLPPKQTTMPSSCKDIRAALATCLQNSDCVLIHRNKPADCLRQPLVETLPERCLQLKKGYGECRRGMLDMRKRFRGNYPVALSAELEGGGRPSSGGQLYAGRPAMGVRETDGREDERNRGEGEES